MFLLPSWRRLVHLFNVPLLDLAHEIGSMEQIVLRLCGHFARHNKKLIVNHLAPDNWASRGNEMCSPLKDEGYIPENQARAKQGNCRERSARTTKQFRGA